MKILSYTRYRTGSRSFGEWLSIELDLPYYHEPFNPKFLLNPFIVICGYKFLRNGRANVINLFICIT